MFKKWMIFTIFSVLTTLALACDEDLKKNSLATASLGHYPKNNQERREELYALRKHYTNGTNGYPKCLSSAKDYLFQAAELGHYGAREEINRLLRAAREVPKYSYKLPQNSQEWQEACQ